MGVFTGEALEAGIQSMAPAPFFWGPKLARLQLQLARPVHMLNICLASAMTIPWFWENLELPNVWQHLTHLYDLPLVMF